MEFNDFWAQVTKFAPIAPSPEFERFYLLMRLAYYARNTDSVILQEELRSAVSPKC